LELYPRPVAKFLDSCLNIRIWTRSWRVSQEDAHSRNKWRTR